MPAVVSCLLDLAMIVLLLLWCGPRGEQPFTPAPPPFAMTLAPMESTTPDAVLKCGWRPVMLYAPGGIN